MRGTTTTTVTTTQTHHLSIYCRASSITPGPKTVITPFCAILIQFKSLGKYYCSEVNSPSLPLSCRVQQLSAFTLCHAVVPLHCASATHISLEHDSETCYQSSMQ